MESSPSSSALRQPVQAQEQAARRENTKVGRRSTFRTPRDSESVMRSSRSRPLEGVVLRDFDSAQGQQQHTDVDDSGAARNAVPAKAPMPSGSDESDRAGSSQPESRPTVDTEAGVLRKTAPILLSSSISSKDQAYLDQLHRSTSRENTGRQIRFEGGSPFIASASRGSPSSSEERNAADGSYGVSGSRRKSTILGKEGSMRSRPSSVYGDRDAERIVGWVSTALSRPSTEGLSKKVQVSKDDHKKPRDDADSMIEWPWIAESIEQGEESGMKIVWKAALAKGSKSADGDGSAADKLRPATSGRTNRPKTFAVDVWTGVLQEDPMPPVLPSSPPNPNDEIDMPQGDILTLLLPLLILMSTMLFVLLLFAVLVLIFRRNGRIALTEQDGPTDVMRDEEDTSASVLADREDAFLEQLDEPSRRGYQRAKEWAHANPPGSVSTDITLCQFLSIQEKGVSAWSFDPDYESNPSVLVEARTEITFLADGAGMAPQEGGACCVQSNLPIPKLNEVYYWEVKMFDKPDTTNVAVGLTTKPYPSFRFPGWHKYSVGFYSADGFKCHNHPWASQSYGPAYKQGDVIGVGYRPRTGTVFFTRNGKKLEDAFIGLNRHNFFPTVGADGPAEIHVNFGQAGFVFIEANVKKWGLAPMVGTLAPPPAYGHEGGSILIETGQSTSSTTQQSQRRQYPRHPPPPISPASSPDGTVSRSDSPRARARKAAHGRRRRPRGDFNSAIEPSSSHGVPLESVLIQQSPDSPIRPRAPSGASDDQPHNPPTPNGLDISMHSLHEDYFNRNRLNDPPPYSLDDEWPEGSRSRNSWLSMIPGFGGASRRRTGSPSDNRTPSRRSSRASSIISIASDDTPHPHASRVPSRTQSLTNSVYAALSERGLLAPLSPNAELPPSLRQDGEHRSREDARPTSYFAGAHLRPPVSDSGAAYEGDAGSDLEAATSQNTEANRGTTSALNSTLSAITSFFRPSEQSDHL